MNRKIRLGPVAVFLVIIAAVLSSLAALTVATSRADEALAERFAQVTRIRYGLEADGSRFLSEAAEGTLPEGAERTEDGTLLYQVERDGYEMTAEAERDADGGISVRQWKIRKIWEGADPFEDLWLGD